MLKEYEKALGAIKFDNSFGKNKTHCSGLSPSSNDMGKRNIVCAIKLASWLY